MHGVKSRETIKEEEYLSPIFSRQTTYALQMYYYGLGGGGGAINPFIYERPLDHSRIWCGEVYDHTVTCILATRNLVLP